MDERGVIKFPVPAGRSDDLVAIEQHNQRVHRFGLWVFVTEMSFVFVLLFLLSFGQIAVMIGIGLNLFKLIVMIGWSARLMHMAPEGPEGPGWPDEGDDPDNPDTDEDPWQIRWEKKWSDRWPDEFRTAVGLL